MAYRLLLALLLTSALAACSSSQSRSEDAAATGAPGRAQPFDDDQELLRTWRAALVRIPDGSGGVIDTDVDALEDGLVAPDQSLPLVVYLHGCNGFWSGTEFRVDWLANNGFAVIAPLSLARSFYPASCILDSHESGLYRPTLTMRQLDAGHAIEQARQLSWVDTDNLFLMGLSEGAAVAATFSTRDKPDGYVKARVAESWTCHSGWSEYRGLNAGTNEAVLSLLAAEDPWYTRAFHQGDCGEFMAEGSGSQSFVADYPPLLGKHALLEDAGIQEIVLDFLLRQMVSE